MRLYPRLNPHPLEELAYLQRLVECNRAIEDCLEMCIDNARDHELALRALADLSNWFRLKLAIKVPIGSAKAYEIALKKFAKDLRLPRLKELPELTLAEVVRRLDLSQDFDLAPSFVKADAKAKQYAQESCWLPDLIRNGGGECPVWVQFADDLFVSTEYMEWAKARTRRYFRFRWGATSFNESYREWVEDVCARCLYITARSLIGRAAHWKELREGDQKWIDAGLHHCNAFPGRVMRDEMFGKARLSSALERELAEVAAAVETHTVKNRQGEASEWERFEEKGRKGWRNTATGEKVYMDARRVFLQTDRPSDSQSDAGVAAPEQPDPVENDEQRRLVDFALRCLPAAQEMAYRMYYYDDMSWPEIAQIMGCSEKTLRRLRQAAVETLTESLKRFGRE